MEKRLPLILAFLLTAFSLFADPEDITFIRIRLWAPYDAVPSLESSAAGQSGYNASDPLKHASDLLKETGNFVINAMVYGWDFSITPKDNTRGVNEYVEFTPIKETSVDTFDITWSNIVYEPDRITCWVEFDRTPLMMHTKAWWNSVNCPRIHGTGESVYTGKIEAIKQAFFDAAKNAVLNYVKKLEKNKPKEITGSLLLKTDTPGLRIDSGKYVSDLDFFLHVDKIVRYSY
ncbi:MAG: hypothetical protein J5647_01790 [Spirochaetaceae bacterium]|nr:hypothetical protein [Spirochaetaceae bacterium]